MLEQLYVRRKQGESKGTKVGRTGMRGDARAEGEQEKCESIWTCEGYVCARAVYTNAERDAEAVVVTREGGEGVKGEREE